MKLLNVSTPIQTLEGKDFKIVDEKGNEKESLTLKTALLKFVPLAQRMGLSSDEQSKLFEASIQIATKDNVELSQFQIDTLKKIVTENKLKVQGEDVYIEPNFVIQQRTLELLNNAEDKK